MKKEEDNVVFIDSQNVNLGVRSCGWQLDWQRFAPGKIVRLDVMERKLQYKRKELQQDRS